MRFLLVAITDYVGCRITDGDALKNYCDILFTADYRETTSLNH